MRKQGVECRIQSRDPEDFGCLNLILQLILLPDLQAVQMIPIPGPGYILHS